MSNMSYCRFRNTRGDLSDCIEALVYGEIHTHEEIAAARSMVREFLDWAVDVGIIDEYNDRIISEHINRGVEEDDEETME